MTDNNTKIQNPITFRCPLWLKQQIDQKVAETVIGNSTNKSLYHFTRTDVILESLIKSNGFIRQEDRKVESEIDSIKSSYRDLLSENENIIAPE